MDAIVGLFQTAAGDRRRGAAEIERCLVDGLLLLRADWTAAALAEGAAVLRTGQPAMANLKNLARGVADGGVVAVEKRLRRRARVLADLDERLAESAWPWIEGCERVLTISRSSSVAAVLVGAWNRGWRGEVVIFDGSPAGGGAEQAERLAEMMTSVCSQPDAAMSAWFDEEGTVVVVGADAVSPRRLINVCGTAALLETAAGRQVPVVVAADSGKDLSDDELTEILQAGPVVSAPGVRRRWSLFEAVAMDLVTARVSE
ncbi:MAG: hypothetical protein V2I67_15855 [Thermoanaerobaculales bacterium]|jgi:translation initiation factor 2B subunit (eIF-2B alpha/beta/delta family)|nr:hypothetical protein [Thermoanaerobaculales bacterium]